MYQPPGYKKLAEVPDDMLIGLITGARVSTIPSTLTAVLGFKVSRQALSYRLKKIRASKILDNKAAFTDKVSADDIVRNDLCINYGDKIYRRVLVISDLHAPYQYKKALDFIAECVAKIKPDLVISVGDELDYHAMSYHDSDPDLDSAGMELVAGRKFLQELARMIPNLAICHSNHGSMKYRKAKSFGIPKHLMVSYRDSIFSDRDANNNIINSGIGDGWFWAETIVFNTPADRVIAKHSGSKDNAENAIVHNCNFVQGHHHSDANIVYTSTHDKLLFGMTVGCLIDKSALAYTYNKFDNRRPIISCGCIIDGIPQIIPVKL